ncbi:MAG: hypothetical protein EHM20_07140 [Alphaproteobacteria bacterium]|nr:MAG: hypothetical protein EHM20_07140 [Alphaproteobacteria bacterium]
MGILLICLERIFQWGDTDFYAEADYLISGSSHIESHLAYQMNSVVAGRGYVKRHLDLMQGEETGIVNHSK